MSCIIRYNWSCRGGGLYSRGGSPTMSGCTVRGNVTGTKNSWESMGGGICCRGSSFEITNCMITENTALGRFSYGGGIYRGVGPIRNCVITRNFAQDSGGALNDYKGSIVDCNISYNIAGRDSGGLRFCDGPIVNCTICYNRAHEEDTGAIGGSGDVINCIIAGNSSGRDAGAMGSCYGGIVANCIISGNQAGRNGGALRAFTGVLINCTIANNFAGGQGGAIHDGQGLINNCIISRNSSGDSSVLSACSVPSYSCRQEDSNGIGCIVSDPRFVEGGYWADMNDANVGVEPNDPNAVWIDGNYRLLSGSPCIDAGDNNSVPEDTTDLDGDGNTTEPIPWDLDGNVRIEDGDDDGNAVVDMGAYEFVILPIEVPMKFTPQALNPGSKGNWVKAHFVLPEEYKVEDVDANRPAILKPGDVESEYMNVFINDDGLVEIEAAFNRSDFCSIVTGAEPMEVMVAGWLTSGQQFYGTDTIKITNNYLEYLAGLASRWLETGCGKPDWCCGLDLDQNSLVNFRDFTLFDGCCIEVIKE